MQKRKYLTVLLLFSWLAPMAQAQHAARAEQIRLFYDSYMKCVEECDSNKSRDLQDKFLTPEMLKKKGRLMIATGADPILRAQDVSAYGRQSLKCRHLEGNWFEVSYRWYEQDTNTIRIPVKAEDDEKGMVRINYIVPDWGGNSYGDYLFDIQAQRVTDSLDAHTFVESFFKAYAFPYVMMSSCMEQDLDLLRKRYCTSSFLQGKYVAIKRKYMEDYEYIDPLIDCADFDAFWYPSIKVDSIDSLTFHFGYNNDINSGWHTEIKVTVKREKGRFLISDIETE